MANNKSELRKDYIQDKYVIVAPLRNKYQKTSAYAHGHSLNYEVHHHHFIKKSDCVFCKKNFSVRSAKVVVGDKKNWEIVVVPNKYPALSLKNPKAYGEQDVVVETPFHDKQLEDLPLTQIVKILEVYAIRTRALDMNPKIEYVLIFKNNGGRAGASVTHSHSQIFATNFLPPHLLDKSQRVQSYKLKTGRCVYCDVIKKEMSGPRKVYQDDYVVAFTPYASVYNYELWIMPRRHIDNVTNLSTEELKSFAKILKDSLTKLVHQLKMPYNFYFHQVINDEDQHLYLKIAPRGTVWGGVEVGSGLVINPVAPELAAKFYRKK